VPDGALSRVPAAEDRNRDRLAVVAKLLDTPVAGVLAIREYLGAKIIWARAAGHLDLLPLSNFRTPARVNSFPRTAS
jgi:hypothetical protein